MFIPNEDDLDLADSIIELHGARAISEAETFLYKSAHTQDLYDRMNEMAGRQAQAAVASYDRNVVPTRVRTLTRDPRRNY